MKVLHLITTLERGGAEMQLLELCKSQKEKDYSILVIYLKGNPSLNHSFESMGIRALKLKSFRTFIELNQLICKSRLAIRDSSLPSVIHAHLPRAELVGLILSKISGLKLIVSKHNSEIMWPNGNETISRALAKVVGKHASAIVCISKSVKDFLVGVGEIDSNMQQKTFIVHYGIDLENIPTSRELDLVRKSTIQVGTLSRLETQKDLPTLLAAIKLVVLAYPNVKLIIHGEGSQKASLMKLRNELLLQNHVEILGKISSLEAFYSKCDIFVLTSKYEGFGLVLLESMYFGTPLLSSNSVAASEVLLNSNELLFQVGDSEELARKIIALIESPEVISDNLEVCRNILRIYDISNARDRLEEIYER